MKSYTIIMHTLLLFLLVIPSLSITSHSFVNNSHTHSQLLSFSEAIVEAKVGDHIRQLIKLKVGTPAQTLKVKLSTAICGIWLLNKDRFQKGIDTSLSTTIENLEIDGKVDFTRGIMMKDYINLCGLTSQDKVPFLVVNSFTDETKTPRTYDGLLGFGFQCRSSSIGNVNLVKLLTKSSEYDQDIMAFTYDSVSTNGRLTIGKLPSFIHTYDKLYKTTKLDIMNINGHWEVLLHSIYFDDGTLIELKTSLSIGVGGALFGIGKDIFEYIQYKYFSKLIETDMCKLEKGEVYEIYCDDDYDYTTFGDVHLIIGKWNMKIPVDRLFKTLDNGKKKKVVFKIVYYPSENEQFYLSQTLLSGVNTIVYNREDYTLGYYQGGEV